MRMLREASAEDFNKALVSGMRKNATESELAVLQDRLGQLERVIADIGTVRKGDAITLDYVPGHGMTLAVNGAIKGPSIHGADFYRTPAGDFCRRQPGRCPTQERAAGAVAWVVLV
jgi:hypothetical protein